MMNRPLELSTLPDEILFKITSHLTDIDLNQLLLTKRRFYNFISQFYLYPAYGKVLYLSEFMTKELNALEENIAWYKRSQTISFFNPGRANRLGRAILGVMYAVVILLLMVVVDFCNTCMRLPPCDGRQTFDYFFVKGMFLLALVFGSSRFSQLNHELMQDPVDLATRQKLQELCVKSPIFLDESMIISLNQAVSRDAIGDILNKVLSDTTDALDNFYIYHDTLWGKNTKTIDLDQINTPIHQGIIKKMISEWNKSRAIGDSKYIEYKLSRLT